MKCNKIILAKLERCFENKLANKQDEMLLHMLVENRELSEAKICELLELYIAKGADINHANRSGNTILHVAVQRRMKKVIELCLRRNAKTADFGIDHSYSIAHFAVEEEFRKMHAAAKSKKMLVGTEGSCFIAWMASRGFDFFFTKNLRGFTPLYLAIYLNLYHIMMALLTYIQDFTRVQKYHTPLLLAFLNREGFLDYQTEFYYNEMARVACTNHTKHENGHRRLARLGVNETPLITYRKMMSLRSKRHMECYEQDIVKLILEKDKTIADETLCTALYLAIINREKKVIDILIDKVRRTNYVHFCDEHCRSLVTIFSNSFQIDCIMPIRDEKTKHDLEILRTLFLQCKGMKFEDRQLVARKLFVRHPRLEVLKMLKESEIDLKVNSSNPDENFMSLVSQFAHQESLLKFMMDELNCDVNMNICHGRTPLFLAIASDNVVIAKSLINHGAKIDILDDNGVSPIRLAFEMHRVKIADKIIKDGIDLAYTFADGKTLLHVAANELTLMKILFIAGLDAHNDSVDCVTSGNSPDWYYMQERHYYHIRLMRSALDSPIMSPWLLYRSGMPVNAGDKYGKTPLHFADNAVTVRMLCNFGAHVDALDNKGRTPLYDALRRNNVEVTLELIKFGADLLDRKILKAKCHLRRGLEAWEIVITHLCKMRLANINRNAIEESKIVKESTALTCTRLLFDIKFLKNYFINDGTSLYDMLHKDRNYRRIYVGNKNLKDFLYSSDNQKEYVEYDLVQSCYNEAVSRKMLLPLGNLSLTKLTKRHWPYICSDRVFNYVSNADILRIIHVSETI